MIAIRFYIYIIITDVFSNFYLPLAINILHCLFMLQSPDIVEKSSSKRFSSSFCKLISSCLITLCVWSPRVSCTLPPFFAFFSDSRRILFRNIKRLFSSFPVKAFIHLHQSHIKFSPYSLSSQPACSSKTPTAYTFSISAKSVSPVSIS